MSDAFVSERMAGLQKYLQKLAAHPIIGASEVGGAAEVAAAAAAAALRQGWCCCAAMLTLSQVML